MTNKKHAHTKTKKNIIISRNICNLSSKFLKTMTTPSIYKTYELHIKDITNKFTKSQNILLNDILNIKNENANKNNFIISPIKTHLDKYNEIPHFIDIFRYLIYSTDFINNFTSTEQQLLKEQLNAKNTYEQCYNYLVKSKLGNKILQYYNKINYSTKNEIITKYPSIKFHSLLINSFTSFEIIKDLDLL